MVAAEAAAAGCPPLVARHSGLAEVAAGLEAAYPPRCAHLASFTDRRRGRRSRERLASCSRLPAADRELRPRRRAARRRRALELGRRSRGGCSTCVVTRRRIASRARRPAVATEVDRLAFPLHGRRTARAVRAAPRARRASASTRPTTSPSRSRRSSRSSTRDARPRQPLRGRKAAAQGTGSSAHLVGELIASEVEVKTGQQRDVRRRPRQRWPSGARELAALVEPLGLALGATGTHPWASWQDQRIIDTPHYRRNDEILRYVVWRNNTFGLHVHVGDPRRRPRDRGRRRRSATGCPSCSRSRRARRSSRASTPASTRRGRRSSRASSRAAACPTRSTRWDEYERYVRFLYETGSIDEHTQLWWSVRPHLAFPTVEIRICDGAARPRRGAGARRARASRSTARIARALDEGEPLAGAAAPADRGEHVAGDPLRALRRADRPRARRRRCPRAPGSSG